MDTRQYTIWGTVSGREMKPTTHSSVQARGGGVCHGVVLKALTISSTRHDSTCRHMTLGTDPRVNTPATRPAVTHYLHA